MKKFLKKHELKLRFLFAGGFNTLVGLSTYPILYFALKTFHLHYMVILVLNHSICVPIAYITNKYLVFRTRGNHLKEFLRFSSFYSIYFLANLLLMPLMVEVAGMHPALTQVIIGIGIIASSFLWHSKITFAPGK